jgi:hypothetical protein
MRMVIWLHERAGSAPSPFSRLSMPALGQQTPGTAPAVVPAQGPDGWEEEWGVAGRGASGTVRRSKCPMPTAMAHKTRSCAVSSIRVPGCPCACARRAFSRSGAPSILTSSCCRRSSLSLRTIAESSAAGVVHSDSRWGGGGGVRPRSSLPRIGAGRAAEHCPWLPAFADSFSPRPHAAMALLTQPL